MVLQAGVLARLNIKPDLLLILLVFFAVYSDTSEAIITSFSIGFAADIVVIGSAMGPQIIGFGLVGTLLAYLHRVIAIRKMPYQAAAIFVTGVLAGAVAHLLGALKGQPLTHDMYTDLFATSLYSAIVGPFLFLPSAWWMRIKTQRF
jgi:rod shape-determining protein MreD